tara:strand:+ start:701 stop:1264 length:564 start_codon:yes stop_codon:yes gene_type:complete
MDPELKKIEAELERIAPGRMPEGMISRIEAAMEGWKDVSWQDEETKVVPFPRVQQKGAPEEERRGKYLWAAVAGMALLGAVAGMVLTSDPMPAGIVGKGSGSKAGSGIPAGSPRPEAPQTIEMAPKTAKRTILDATNGNVIIPNGAEPLRLMRVDLIDRVMFSSPGGEEVHLEVPSVNYRLVPAPTD